MAIMSEASLEIANRALDRLDVDPKERADVLFLIANDFELSAALRRDLFDPATVAAFAEKMGTPERLKMLCLLPYLSIKAVNPGSTHAVESQAWQLHRGREFSKPRRRPARTRRRRR